MALPSSLLDRITAFLATPSPSQDGGYALVDEADMGQLADILRELIAAKYEADVDGDRPVSFQLVDRTRYQWQPFMMLRHLGRRDAGHDLLAIQANLRQAMCNLSLAQHQVEAVQHHWDANVVAPMTEGLPVFVGRQAYVQHVPARDDAALKTEVTLELEEHLAGQSLRELLDNATFQASWVEQVTQALKEKIKMPVIVRLYRSRRDPSQGVVSVELPGRRQRDADYGPLVTTTRTLTE
jgi:acyl-CoA-binding protein